MPVSRDKGADQIRTGVYDLSFDSGVRTPEFGVDQSSLDCARLDAMPIKYLHARLPGRELIHLIPPDGLTIDQRFGDEEHEFVVGFARALCGQTSKGWIWGSDKGERCSRCDAARHQPLKQADQA